MRLEVMTWKQAERYFQTHDMAVLPIGSIENHGSHLALGTDFLVPSKIAEQLDRESDVLILPAVRTEWRTITAAFRAPSPLDTTGYTALCQKLWKSFTATVYADSFF